MKRGFDSERYLTEQSKFILERVNSCKKLYLEFGGKLMNDLHAKRVLPGYDENAKIKLDVYKRQELYHVFLRTHEYTSESNKVFAY